MKSDIRMLVINADDLGISRAVNAEVFSLMAAGLVTSSTLLANGAASDDAIQRARDFPQCSFGVHLNITCGRPVDPSARLGPLLDEHGFLTPRIFALRIDSALRRAITTEWCAQVESLRSRGLPISHLDSHEHVHTIPALFPALKAAQRRFGIRRARLTKNLYCRELPAGSVCLRSKKAIWNLALQRIYRTRTTRWFGELFSLIHAARSEHLASGSIEAMVHPGAVDEPINVEELRELRGGALQRLPFPVRLVSYHDV